MTIKRYDMQSIVTGIGEYEEMVEAQGGDWVRFEDYEVERLAMCEANSNAVLGEVLAELMEEIEKENKEENIGRARITTIDGNEIRLDDLIYGYELRFKKVLGKYFA